MPPACPPPPSLSHIHTRARAASFRSRGVTSPQFTVVLSPNSPSASKMAQPPWITLPLPEEGSEQQVPSLAGGLGSQSQGGMQVYPPPSPVVSPDAFSRLLISRLSQSQSQPQPQPSHGDHATTQPTLHGTVSSGAASSPRPHQHSEDSAEGGNNEMYEPGALQQHAQQAGVGYHLPPQPFSAAPAFSRGVAAGGKPLLTSPSCPPAPVTRHRGSLGGGDVGPGAAVARGDTESGSTGVGWQSSRSNSGRRASTGDHFALGDALAPALISPPAAPEPVVSGARSLKYGSIHASIRTRDVGGTSELARLAIQQATAADLSKSVTATHTASGSSRTTASVSTGLQPAPSASSLVAQQIAMQSGLALPSPASHHHHHTHQASAAAAATSTSLNGAAAESAAAPLPNTSIHFHPLPSLGSSTSGAHAHGDEDEIDITMDGGLGIVTGRSSNSNETAANNASRTYGQFTMSAKWTECFSEQLSKVCAGWILWVQCSRLCAGVSKI